MKRTEKFVLMAVAVWLLPCAVYANVAIPMIYFEFPAMVIALVPVIALEFFVARKWISVPWKKIFLGISGANLASTLLGVPLAYGFILGFGYLLGLLGFELGSDQSLLSPIRIIWSAAYVGPYRFYNWMAATGFMTFLVPAFFISVFLERAILIRVFAEVEKAAVRKAVWKMNVFSYILLFGLGLAALIILLVQDDLTLLPLNLYSPHALSY